MELITSLQTLQNQSQILEILIHRRQVFNASIATLQAQASHIAYMAEHIVQALHTGHKVMAAGNGGSAAEAQHFVAELVGRFKYERSPYPALALTADSAVVSAISNDYGYQQVFARQVHAHAQPGDLLLAFSTSGESENLIQAALAGKEQQVMVFAITGDRSSRLEQVADFTIRVPGVDTAITQELQMLLTHILCEVVETTLVEEGQRGSASSHAQNMHTARVQQGKQEEETQR